jgi:hypothetical protein
MNKSQTIGVFEKLLSAINKDSSLEFEVKYRDKFSNYENQNFTSGISPSIFHKIIDTLKQKCKDSIDSNIIYIMLDEGEPLRFTNQSIRSLPSDAPKDLHTFKDYRFTVYNDNVSSTPEVIEKKRLNIPGFKTCVFPQGFKLSLSKEMPIDEQSENYKQYFQYIGSEDLDMLVRDKTRYRFLIQLQDEQKNTIPILEIDLTKVSFGNGSFTETVYELELEYLGNRYWEFMGVDIDKRDISRFIVELEKHSKEISEIFVDTVKFLLSEVQQTPILIDINKHNQLFLEYLKLVGLYDGREMYAGANRDVFVGCQPETLHLHHFDKIVEEDYIVLDKSDGERMLMFIHDKCIYLIDRWMHIKNTGGIVNVNELNGSLLDGEWIYDNEKEKYCYLIFDVLFLQKKDVRSQSTFTRFKYIQQIVDALNIEDDTKNEFFESKKNDNKKKCMVNANFDIRLKKFIRWNKNKTRKVDQLLQMPYPTDGLIFIPNTPAPKTRKWSSLFKWKPPKLNTIDLYVEKVQSDEKNANKFSLYIQTNIIVFNREIYLLLSNEKKSRWLIGEDNNVIVAERRDYSDSFKNNKLLKQLHNRSIQIPFPFQTHVMLRNDDIPLKTNCVYEFYFDYNSKTLRPHKLRYDKSARGYKGSNHLTVACDIWDSICNVITKDTILNLNENTFDKELCTKRLRSKEVSSMFSKNFNVKELFSGYRNHLSDDEKQFDKESKSSPLWKIKRFHNNIKSELIKQYCDKSYRTTLNDVFQRLKASTSTTESAIAIPNSEYAINLLNAELGVTRKQLSFSHDKSYILISKDLNEHLQNVMISSKKISVLDIGMGKGGDLWKYCGSKGKPTLINYVIGVENEPYLITGADDCALKRFKEIKNETNTDTKVCFFHMDGRTNIYSALDGKGVKLDVDVVNCFFCIHYFFRDEKSLSLLLQNVNEMLTYNGHLVGTLIDGETVHGRLGFHENHFTDNNLFSIKGKYDRSQPYGLLSPYGNSIDVYLKDSIIHDYDHRQPYTKKEYLVLFDKFVKIAKHFDLELIESSMFEEFYPNYKGPKLTEDEKKYSFINRTFVFKKVSNSRYHKEYVSASRGNRNDFIYNHGDNINDEIQNQLSTIQNVQLATMRVTDDLDKTLIEEDKDIVLGLGKSAKSVNSANNANQNDVDSNISELFKSALKPSKRKIKIVKGVRSQSSTKKIKKESAKKAEKTKKGKKAESTLPAKTFVEQTPTSTKGEATPKKKRKTTTSNEPTKTKKPAKKQGCGHRGKGCKECKGCKCRINKVKCVEGVCKCNKETCTNR